MRSGRISIARSSELQARRRGRGGLAGCWPLGQRLPTGDDPDALARLGVVGDQREVPAELDDARQLAALVIGATDGFGSKTLPRPQPNSTGSVPDLEHLA